MYAPAERSLFACLKCGKVNPCSPAAAHGPLAQAINGEALPSGLRVLRSRDAAVLEDIDGDAVKALDFGGRVTMASTKNLQLQVLLLGLPVGTHTHAVLAHGPPCTGTIMAAVELWHCQARSHAQPFCIPTRGWADSPMR